MIARVKTGELARCPFIIVDSFLYVYLKPFRIAGRKFGWDKPIAGLALNHEVLRYALNHNLLIRVLTGGGRCYEASPETWLVWAVDHGSIHFRKDVKLYCIPWLPEFFKTVSAEAIHPEAVEFFRNRVKGG